MADRVKTVTSIKAYCTTVCQENEMRGHKPVRKGIRFYCTIQGIKCSKQHKVHRAEPLTTELLNKINKVVNEAVDKQLVNWTALVSGFNMVLRKSNLVPLKRVHDTVHNIT